MIHHLKLYLVLTTTETNVKFKTITKNIPLIQFNILTQLLLNTKSYCHPQDIEL